MKLTLAVQIDRATALDLERLQEVLRHLGVRADWVKPGDRVATVCRMFAEPVFEVDGNAGFNTATSYTVAATMEEK